jgi:23S rRNA (adenine2503-C2)-methyltransferase
MTKKDSISTMEILSIQGDPQVAEVAIARFRGEDRYSVEMVDGLTPPLTRQEKWIINISTQFGCPVACPFCDAAMDYAGNLRAEELLAQVRWGLDRHAERSKDCRKLKVHFARMGEPALNDATLEAARRLPELVKTDGLWCCLASVAPKGRENFFVRLYEIKESLYRGRFQLQFSVQSTSEKDRLRLTPIKHWSLKEIAAFGQGFHQPSDRKVVLNFALAQDVSFDPEVILDLFDPAHFAIKLTPVNPTAQGHANGFNTILRSEQDGTIKSACEDLHRQGFDVVLSVGDEREDQVGSNCGQAVRISREKVPLGKKQIEINKLDGLRLL